MKQRRRPSSRSGAAATKLLAREGFCVYASDVADSAMLRATASTLSSPSVSVDVGSHDLERIAGAVVVIASPGVPPNAPPLQSARDAGVDLEKARKDKEKAAKKAKEDAEAEEED